MGKSLKNSTLTTTGWTEAEIIKLRLQLQDGRQTIPEWKLDALSELMSTARSKVANPSAELRRLCEREKFSDHNRARRDAVIRRAAATSADRPSFDSSRLAPPGLLVESARSKRRLDAASAALQSSGGNVRKAARAMVPKRIGRPPAPRLDRDQLERATIAHAKKRLLETIDLDWTNEIEVSVRRWAQEHGAEPVLSLGPCARKARTAVLGLQREAGRHLPAPDAESIFAAATAFLNAAGRAISRIQRPDVGLVRALRLLKSDPPPELSDVAHQLTGGTLAAVAVLLGHEIPLGPRTATTALKAVAGQINRRRP